MQNRNFQRELDKLIEDNAKRGEVPRLLLHSCCAPCSSYCLEYLAEHFEVTVLYYNPNITDEAEYLKRAAEQKRLIAELPVKHRAGFVEGEYRPGDFYEAVKGLEDVPEGGARCFKCYRLRLEYAARYAAERGFDFYCTTLSISPLKNAAKLNEIGEELSEIYSVPWLPSDFKKRGGYQRSIALSREYGLYRQDYCGCGFSKRERENNANVLTNALK